jgi:hypothetical protein
VVNWQQLQRTGELPNVATTPEFGTRLGKTMTDISTTRHQGFEFKTNKNPGHVVTFSWRGAVEKKI